MTRLTTAEHARLEALQPLSHQRAAIVNVMIAVRGVSVTYALWALPARSRLHGRGRPDRGGRWRLNADRPQERPGCHLHRRRGGGGSSAHAVVQLSSAPPGRVLGTTSIFSGLLLAAFGVTFAGSVQAAFERIWDLLRDGHGGTTAPPCGGCDDHPGVGYARARHRVFLVGASLSGRRPGLRWSSPRSHD
jgi:hypothetical protein